MKISIPPESRSAFYAFTGASLLLGFLLGSLFTGYLVYRNESALLSGALQPAPTASTTAPALTPEQVRQAASLDANKMLLGRVVSVGADTFSLSVQVSSTEGAATTTTVAIPFDPAHDQVVIASNASKSSPLVKTASVSFSDIKVGSIVSVQVLAGKKVVYLVSPR